MRVVLLCSFFVLAVAIQENRRGKQNFPMLRGVNKSGTEYACIKEDGFFDGDHSEATVLKMKEWKINAVRVPLNENCWLGGFASEEFTGENYKREIKSWIELLRSHGMYVVIDMHWSEGLYEGPGQTKAWNNIDLCYDQGAKCQKPMPDLAKAPTFWKEVAETFKHDEGIIFDLFNEPFPNRPMGKNKTKAWQCWRNGHEDCKPEIEYDVAGMQDLVDAVRGTGAKNLLMLGGLEYSNDLENWMDYLPEDPEGNLAASMHAYSYNSCVTEECWEKGIGKISEKVMVVVGEMGENDCDHVYIDDLMPYLDKKGINYFAWTWNAWNNCKNGPDLILDNEGTPNPYGQGYKDHLDKFTPVYSVQEA